MTVTTTPTVPPVARPARFAPLAWDLARSEWTKLRSVRSTYWTLLCTIVGMIVFGGLLDSAYARHYGGTGRPPSTVFDPAAYSMSGFFLAQLAIAVLGVVIVTSEFQTRSIRATLTSAPQRIPVLTAKATVFGAVAAITGLVSAAGSFAAGQLILPDNLRAHIDDPGAIRSVVGAGLYVAVLGLLALGIGTLIRRTAGAIATVVGLIVIVPVFIEGLPQAWQDTISKFLPSTAGQAVIGHTRFTPPATVLLTPWTGFAVLCGYTAVVLIAAAITLDRRDA